MAKIVTMKEAAGMLKDGMSVMVAGFLGAGGPSKLLHEIAQTGVKDLTVMANDGAKTGWALGELISNGQVKKLIATHIGLNPEVGKKMNAGEMEVELVP